MVLVSGDPAHQRWHLWVLSDVRFHFGALYYARYIISLNLLNSLSGMNYFPTFADEETELPERLDNYPRSHDQ